MGQIDHQTKINTLQKLNTITKLIPSYFNRHKLYYIHNQHYPHIALWRNPAVVQTSLSDGTNLT